MRRLFRGKRLLLLPAVVLALAATLVILGAINAGGGDVTFEVTVPAETPPEDTVFIYIAGNFSGAGRYEMTRVDDRHWTYTLHTDPGAEVLYKYNRNGFGYQTDELFDPDSPDTYRSVVASGDVTQADTVDQWRWLFPEPPTAEISDYVPDLPQRDEPFKFGATLLDFYAPEFTPLLPSTLDRIAASGFEYVGIAYAPRTILSANPLEFSIGPLEPGQLEHVELTITEAHQRGLKVMLLPGMESNPADLAALDAVMAEPHDDAWWQEMVDKWQQVMVAEAIYAEEHGVEVFGPTNQWTIPGYQDDAQRARVNEMIKDAYDAVRAVYSGVITSDYYDDHESVFDFYEKMDWIPDKWWWQLADTKDPTIEDMQAAAEQIIHDQYEPLHEKYGKPIFLAQLGFEAYDGAVGGDLAQHEDDLTTEWNPVSDRYPFDFQEQADATEASLRAIAETPWIVGAVTFGYPYWDGHNKSAGIRDKPVEKVWERWIGLLAETP